MKVWFQKVTYQVIFTEHALMQMALRNLDQSEVLMVIETGEAKAKEAKNKFWVYKKLPRRKDNLISISISLEEPHLIVITTMINWRPQ
jgi:hypothetical protein